MQIDMLQGQGLGGSNATCVQLGAEQGGLTLAMRGGDQPGYQPFTRGNAVSFWLKDANGSATVPDLQVRACQTVHPLNPQKPSAGAWAAAGAGRALLGRHTSLRKRQDCGAQARRATGLFPTGRRGRRVRQRGTPLQGCSVWKGSWLGGMVATMHSTA